MTDTILLNTDDRGVTTLTLNRPDVHNAFDDALIEQLTASIHDVEKDPGTRIIILASSGKSFCAGADLTWMRRAADYTDDENYQDALHLGELLRTLDQTTKPTIARVHGPTYGGGVGLVACCDVALASERAVFSLSEVKLGLVPAMISPFVVRAIGGRSARRYFQSGERFDAPEALRIGLVHEVTTHDALNVTSEAITTRLLEGGPDAQRLSKEIIKSVDGALVDDDLLHQTAVIIAKARTSKEGREGVSAFLEKRKPRWN